MSQIQDGWINHLRKNANRKTDIKPDTRPDTKTRTVQCPVCEIELTADLEQFRQHVASNSIQHNSQLSDDAAIEAAFNKITLRSPEPSKESRTPERSNRKRGATQDDSERPDVPTDQDDSRHESKKRYSPSNSDTANRRTPPATSKGSTGRSRARQPDNSGDFSPRYGPGQRRRGHLFDPQSDPRQTFSPKTPQRQDVAGSSRLMQLQAQSQGPMPETPEASRFHIDPEKPHERLELQPETKPISHEQLVAEVKGIYTGLVMIETKCIEVDTAQSNNTEHQLSSEQWQALIALHRTLLHEHHDFFLASQHPAASDALRRLAAKYAMPARMWRHGIHSFLELLRHRLPDSYDQMLTFIYMAYGMMALLYDTVKAFEDTWVECLGDLARYRMAIEEHDIKDRETWTGVARSWYTIASEKAPTTGRLYHHLAILARPNAVQQLYFYTKSLCVPIPFPSAKESIMTLFNPLFDINPPRLQEIDAAFVRVHAILFSGKHQDQLESSMQVYLGLLDSHIGRMMKKWLEIGYFTGIPLACSLLGYGAEEHFMMKILKKRPDETDTDMDEGTTTDIQPPEEFTKALSFMVRTYEITVRRWGDPNTLPFVNTILVFMDHVSRFPSAMLHLEQEFPWKLTAVMMNLLLRSCGFKPRMDDVEKFPAAQKNEPPRPLPEDFAMRGLVYCEDLYPTSFFRDSQVEENEKYFELSSMTDSRKERILWLGRRLATSGQWLTWDDKTRQFGVAEQYANDAMDVPLGNARPTDSESQGLLVVGSQEPQKESATRSP